MVFDGFFNCIYCLFNYLLENIDFKYNIIGLFEVKFELQLFEMVFILLLDFGVFDGFYEFVERIVNDVYKMVLLVKRLVEYNGFEYYQVKIMIKYQIVSGDLVYKWFIVYGKDEVNK